MSKFGGASAGRAGLFDPPQVPEHGAPADNPLDLDEELFAALNFRIASGEIDPQSTPLHAFETGKLEKTRTPTARNNTRTQRQLKTTEAAKAEIDKDAAARRALIADLEGRLALQTNDSATLREQNRLLEERLAAAEQRMVALESALTAARPALMVQADEKRPQQALKARAETSPLSFRLAEAEAILTAAQGRLRQVAGNVAKVNTERARIAIEIEEERRKQELVNQRTRFEALQERARENDKALVQARKQLSPHSEAVHADDHGTSAAAIKRDVLLARMAELEADRAKREAERNKEKQTPAASAERGAQQTRASSTEGAALARAEGTNAALSERIGRLEAALFAEKQGAAEAIEEIKAALRREKMERLATEGALEIARKDFARLMRKAVAMQRGDKAAEEPATASPNSAKAA